MATIVTTSPSGGGGQPSNTYLTALSNIVGTGIYTVTGLNTAELRTITGGTGVIVTNGDGVAGNPIISLVPNTVIPGTGAVTIPVGTSTDYPVTPSDGMIRYNTTSNLFEFYQNGSWVNLSSGGGSGTVTSVGLVSSTLSITGSPVTTNGTLTANLTTTGVVAGGYTNADIIVDAYGRIISATSGAASGVSQIIAGSGITISPVGGTGVVTISATGGSGSGSVTSVGLASTDFTIVGSPVTTSGTITANLAVQPSIVPGTYPNADIVVNSKGIITNISAGGTSTIRLYTENYILGTPNTVVGLNSFAIGEDNTVTGHNAVALGVSNTAAALGSVAFGNSAVSSFPGQVSHASGKFQTVGDAQGSDYIYRGETGTQFPIEIFLDGVSARLVLTDNSAIAFEALAVARRIDAVGEYAAFRLEGLIKRDSGTGSTAIVGLINKNIIARTNTNLDCNIQAYTPAGSLQVLVQGAAGQIYNWVVRLISVEEIG